MSSLASQPALSIADLSAKHQRQPESLRTILRSSVTPLRVITIVLAATISCLGVSLMETHHFAVERSFREDQSLTDCQRECLAMSHSLCDADALVFKEEWCNVKTAQCFDEEVPNDYFLVRRTTCKFPVTPETWKPYTVVSVLMICIVLIVEGAAAEVMLIGACSLFAALGIISSSQAFGGLASSSVIGLAFLFAIASAIEETGVLEDLVGVMLGSPKNYFMALMRMMFPVVFLSAALSNTAIVAMIIPVIVTWARQLNVSPGKLLMPLSFAAQLGGSCTIIGSSHCLVAKESVPPDQYDMHFFDLSPVGFSVAFTTSFVIYLCAPMLRSSAFRTSMEQSTHEDSTSQPATDPDPTSPNSALVDAEKPKDTLPMDASPASLYTISMIVRRLSSFRGANASDICEQLGRLPGVCSVKPLDSIITLSSGDTLVCICSAVGIVAIRQVRGLALCNEEDVRKLGMGRRHRHLYEAVVNPSSCWVGKPLDMDSSLQIYGCCPLAIRGKESLNVEVAANDVLLIEVDDAYVISKEWSEAFTLVKVVPNSSPPRFGGPRDKQRSVVACFGMLLLIVAVTLGYTKLSYGAALLTCVLLLIRSRSLSQVYLSVKAPVLFVIVGAFGISHALQETGVAHVLAENVTKVAGSYGKIGIRIAVYIVSVGLSMFINNSATVAIMGTMVASMAAEQGMHVSSLTWVLVLAAGSCFTTPLGYQTNMMVMKDGGYTFTDFMRYGFPVQCIHMTLTMIAIWLISDVLGFEGFQ